MHINEPVGVRSAALWSLTASPPAHAYYDQLRDRGKDHNAALRQLANRLVGILHGCLKTNTLYDEHTAWPTFHAAAARRPNGMGCLSCRKADVQITGICR